MSTENSTQETATSQSTTSTTPSASTPISSASTSTPSVSSTAQSAGSSGADVSSALPPVEGAAQQPVMPQYTPDFKFKAFEKEYEVDELFRPLFKDTDTEKKIKALHSKAFALDGMKDKLEGTRKEYDGFKSTVEPKLRAYDHFNKILENKDWDTFFTKLGVPDDEIFGYVEKKLALMQAPPDQKAEYERNMQLRQQAYTLEEQNRQMQTAYQQQAVQTRTMQLESLMSRPDVGGYATAWDEKMGTIGAFKQLVIDEAAAAFYATGQDWTPEQAINHVVRKFGKIVQQGQGQQATQAYGGQPQQTHQPAPVIPHVAGRGTSPVKKVPKSLDDIKKLVSELRD